jgi:hypothetical protein
MQLDGAEGTLRLEEHDKEFLARPDLEQPNDIYPISSSGELLKRARQCMNYNFGHVATAHFFDVISDVELDPIRKLTFVLEVAKRGQNEFATHASEGITKFEQMLAEAGS